MTRSNSTKQKLLDAARDLFWTRGYSNVSVRDITGQAGVDAALVSRYFGGKQGLFEATLLTVPQWSALSADGDAVLEQAVASFSGPFDPLTDQTNPFTMLITNITDPEMGETIRDLVRDKLSQPLADKLGGANTDERAAMLLAVLFGAALMRKHFQTAGIAEKSTDETYAQILHLGKAALRFED